MNKKYAFTLAEVLITLLIIGVVASIIVPSIINDTQKEEYVTGAKKAKSIITQAAELIKMDNGGTYVGAFSNTTDMVNKFAEKLSYSTKCISATNDGTCWHLNNTMMKTLDGRDWGNSSPSSAQGLKLSDGTLIVFYYYDSNCNSSAFSIDTSDINNPFNHMCGELSIDLNGFKPPNRAGRDIITDITITTKGIHVIGEIGSRYGKSQNWSLCTPGNNALANGASCFARIMDEGGMKY